ncbi:MAG: dipeptidase [Acidobacteriota bacterium]
MKRPLFVASALSAGLGVAGTIAFFTVVPGYVDRQLNAVEALPPHRVSQEAIRLHERLFVADLHSDLLLWSRDPLARADHGHTDLPRLREGNVALQVFSVVSKVPKGQNYDRNDSRSDRITPLIVAQRWPLATWRSLKQRALYQARRLTKAAARSQGKLVWIRSAADLERFVERREAEPKITAALLAIEGLHVLEGELRTLEVLYEAGFRMMGLAHFFDNEVAGSAHGVDKGGLTPLGQQVVRRMEELGILVDLAHASPQTVEEVLDRATRPVVVSHTGVQGTCPGPRNLSDAQIRRIAANGGVIGIGFWAGAVCAIDPPSIARAMRYAVDLAGIDHVALGSDFDGSTHTYFDAAGLVQLTDALLEAGFGEEQIRKIMGSNALRLLKETLPREG